MSPHGTDGPSPIQRAAAGIRYSTIALHHHPSQSSPLVPRLTCQHYVDKKIRFQWTIRVPCRICLLSLGFLINSYPYCVSWWTGLEKKATFPFQRRFIKVTSCLGSTLSA